MSGRLFTCVLALTIAHLMRRECARAGLSLSVPAMLAELDGIGETVLLYQGERGRPRAATRVSSASRPPAGNPRNGVDQAAVTSPT